MQASFNRDPGAYNMEKTNFTYALFGHEKNFIIRGGVKQVCRQNCMKHTAPDLLKSKSDLGLPLQRPDKRESSQLSLHLSCWRGRWPHLGLRVWDAVSLYLSC